MKKSKKLELKKEPIRVLTTTQLQPIAGGYNSNVYCPPPPTNTPHCPM